MAGEMHYVDASISETTPNALVRAERVYVRAGDSAEIVKVRQGLEDLLPQG